MTLQPSRLSIDQAPNNTLVVEGVIDSHTADQLMERLRDLGTDSDITLNLQRVEFIDSSGLRIIVTSHQDLASAGQRLVLDGISDAVARLLEITGLREHLHTT